MKYRKFGVLEYESSILGLGTAGLPLCKDASAPSEPEASIDLIRFAVEQGVNYIDLGYPFDLRRHEQIADLVGRALQNGYRRNVRIAVTLPSHLLRSKSDFDLYFERQLGCLQTDRVDFCLFGKINRDNWPPLQKIDALSWADAAIADGRFDAIGFSFHDHFQILRHILESYDRWSLCQFQFSYMDIDHDPGIGGIKYAAQKGKAVVVSEPLRSGRLVKVPPHTVGKIWGNYPSRAELTKLGLRFVWNYPEVTTVVRDFRSLHELSESVDIADSAEADGLAIQEELLINNVRDEFRKLARIGCSSCRPCMPCPEDIDVPRIFEIYNDAFLYEDPETARSIYRNEQHHADLCNRCRECEQRCTRKLQIVELLERAHELLG